MRPALLCSLVLLAGAAPAGAHDGPPYPILVDEPFGDRTLSVWADPDVGVGTFYLYLPEEEDGAGGDARIAAWVQPVDGRLAEARYAAEPAAPHQPYQRVIRADFDARGAWRVRFTLESANAAAESSTAVRVTPAGMGRLDLLWFLTPFLLIASLWMKALHQRRSYRRSPA